MSNRLSACYFLFCETRVTENSFLKALPNDFFAYRVFCYFTFFFAKSPHLMTLVISINFHLVDPYEFRFLFAPESKNIPVIANL